MIVTGKGGTGKTSVAAALALHAASRGRRVLVVETGRDENVPPLLVDPPAPEVGYAGRELRPGLTAMRADPYEALTEYLSRQVAVRPLVRRVLRNRGFRQLLNAAPGWRELIMLGKVWHVQQQEADDGRPLFDHVVVDAPATGHGLTFLDVPRVVVSAVRAGPLRRHASWVAAMLQDPEHTMLLPVALAEELPTRETAELVERVRNSVGVAVDRVVVNAVLRSPLPEAVPDLDSRLAALRTEGAPSSLPPPALLAHCAAHLRARAELHHRYLGRIREATGLPTLPLPLLPGGVHGPEELERLAAPLLERPGEEAA